MKSNRMSVVFISVLALAVMLSGCAKPPTEEMQAAEDAFALAQNDADAQSYGSNSLNRARDALENMRNAVSTKKYDSVKDYAQQVIDLSQRAIADGNAGLQRARDEATNLLSSVQTALGDTTQRVAAARNSNVPVDFVVINGDLGNARTQVNQAETALGNTDYQGSIQKSQSARSILGSIDNRLTQTSIATTRKK